MRLEDFLEKFILINEDNLINTMGFTSAYPLLKKKSDSIDELLKKKIEVRTKKENLKRDLIINKYKNLLDNDEVGVAEETAYHMFTELLDELFYNDERPICEAQFTGDITPGQFGKELMEEYYTAIIDYLELECGIEDIISISYDKRLNLTVIRYYGS